jgi:hypothetical protein
MMKKAVSLFLATGFALTLVADATAAQAPTQHAQKQRRARPAPADQELEKQPVTRPARTPAEAVLPAAQLPRTSAVEKMPATLAAAPDAVANREATTTWWLVKGARRVGILPKVLPPFPGPASPIR